MDKYLKQAESFLEKTGTVIEIEFSHYGEHFEGEKEKRDIYNVCIRRGPREFKFKFGNSIKDSGFYFNVGRTRVEIDRKHLRSKNLSFICRNLHAGFEPSMDNIHRPISPNNYSILASLTKYDVGTFKEFCNMFGYNDDSMKAHKIYLGCREEYLSLLRLYNEEEMELLRQIQ